MAETILSSVLPSIVEKAEKLASVLLDKAVDQYDIMDNIQRDIRSLKTELNEVNGILQEAEERQIDNINVRELLRELTDVSHHANNVLDDFKTAASNNTNRNNGRVMFDCFPFSLFLSCFGINVSSSSIDLQVKLSFSLRFQLANRIKDVIKKLDQIMKQSGIVDIQESLRKEGSNSESASRRPKTISYVNRQRNLFVGREYEKEEIIKKLVNHHGSDVLVVPIWGVGGVGKTTLAQFIYNDIDRVKEEDYPICNRKWFFVGEKKFNAKEIIERIIGESIHPDNAEEIIEKLVQNFKGNKFLIVLDDVWNLNEWNLPFDLLSDVGKGGVIIITTRNREVISTTNTQVQNHLRPLAYEDCWKIFKSYAFVDGKSGERPELEPIGREIVEKLDGHPLAARVVGSSLLNRPDATFWRNFINEWDWNLKEQGSEIMVSLRWSYKLLPPHVRSCFTYCALFPKDLVFDEKVLVQMWMAHDLIQINGDGRPEAIGDQYFNKLVDASLFQFVDGKYVMHDIIRELALLVSNEEFSSAVGSLSTDQMKKVRHITIPIDNEYSKNLSSCKSEKILTVYTPYNKWDETSTTPLEKDNLLEVFKQSKSLRVLVLSNKHITEIPECISELKHLRYLDVKKTSVKSLPNSLCQLHNLQMLAAPLDAVLPRDIVNIHSLRCIRANVPTCRGIEKLKSLQELSSIRVCKDDNIRELGDMQVLRGKLRIEGLGNATSSEDAADALMEKQKLMDKLVLVFNQRFAESTISAQPPFGPLGALMEKQTHMDELELESTISSQVLDALRCPPNLTYLKISDYTGVKSPSWMVDGTHKFDKLQTLGLYDCPKLESLPPLGELTSLKHIHLEKVGVKRLGDEFYGKFTDGKVFFPSLESLSFHIMQEWEEWDDIIIKNYGVSFFPCLTKLEIQFCAKLVSVLPVVKNRTSKWKQEDKHSIMNAANFMTSLSSLNIGNCGLKRLQLDALVSLKDLEINYCRSLVQITSAICLATTIERLKISSCKLIEKMDVARCDKLVSIPPLVGIKILNLEGCVSLRSLNIHIHGLEYLYINGCPKLELAFEDGSSSSSSSMNSVAVPIHGVSTDNTQVFRKLLHHEIVSLESLGITKLEGFENFDETQANNFCKLRSLMSLFILKCMDLKSLPSDFHKLSSLQELYIDNCLELQSLPPHFHKLSSLERLCIFSCPQLQSLPFDGVPPSLRYLEIYDCPLLYKRCKDKSGFDWHKINHIPERKILQHERVIRQDYLEYETEWMRRAFLVSMLVRRSAESYIESLQKEEGSDSRVI